MNGATLDDNLLKMAQGTTFSMWVLAIGVVGYVFTLLPKITESGGNAWTKWLESKRRTAEIRDDADIVELRRQIDILTASLQQVRDEVHALQAEIRLRDRLLHTHFVWDVKAYQTIVRLGGRIEQAPPLFPTEVVIDAPSDGLPTDDPTVP